MLRAKEGECFIMSCSIDEIMKGFDPEGGFEYIPPWYNDKFKRDTGLGVVDLTREDLINWMQKKKKRGLIGSNPVAVAVAIAIATGSTSYLPRKWPRNASGYLLSICTILQKKKKKTQIVA